MSRFGTLRFGWTIVMGAVLVAATVLARPLHAQEPVPRISSVQPDPIVGSIDWTELTIRGRGFDEDFAVRLHAEDVVDTVVEAEDRLTYVDAQTVRVRAVFGTAASTWSVQVLYPDSVSSNVHTFRVEAPPPKIDVVRPLRRTQDGSAFKVTVQGSTMTPASTVRWNGNDLPTTPIKSSPKPNAITIGLKATVPPDVVEGPGQNAITVHTAPAGGRNLVPDVFHRGCAAVLSDHVVLRGTCGPDHRGRTGAPWAPGQARARERA
jgi:hypothetical protein